MPRVQYSSEFVIGFSEISSSRLENEILNVLDSLQLFGEYGSLLVPDSIRRNYGDGVRKVAISPFDLIYTFYPEDDLVRIEALVPQRSAS